MKSHKSRFSKAIDTIVSTRIMSLKVCTEYLMAPWGIWATLDTTFMYPAYQDSSIILPLDPLLIIILFTHLVHYLASSKLSTIYC